MTGAHSDPAKRYRPQSEMVIGQTFESNNYGTMKIVATKGKRSDIVFIATGFQTNVENRRIKIGVVKDKLVRNVCGVGFVGIGPFKPKTKAHKLWETMIFRCYSNGGIRNYKDCWVAEEWHCFQNFAEWFHGDKSYYQDGLQLDKDWIVLGNKIYGPNTCSFVPGVINGSATFLRTPAGADGRCVIKSANGYDVRIRKNGIRSNIGTFPTRKKAEIAYYKEKLSNVKEMVQPFIGKIHPLVHENMIGEFERLLHEALEAKQESWSAK